MDFLKTLLASNALSFDGSLVINPIVEKPLLQSTLDAGAPKDAIASENLDRTVVFYRQGGISPTFRFSLRDVLNATPVGNPLTGEFSVSYGNNKTASVICYSLVTTAFLQSLKPSTLPG